MLKIAQKVLDTWTLHNQGRDSETYKFELNELNIVLDRIDNSDKHIQLVGGNQRGWFLIDPVTYNSVDLDDYYNHLTADHDMDYFDFLDKLDNHEETIYNEAVKAGFEKPLAMQF